MTLNDKQIRELCEQGLVEPYAPELVNPASLDVRVGNYLMEETEDGSLYRVSLGDVFSQTQPYRVLPGQSLLVETLEVFHMPDDVAAQVVLKSSRVREGWSLGLGGWVDPGFNNSVLTLRLRNDCQYRSLTIWSGMKLAQLCFSRMELPEVSYRQVGNYNNARTVTPSR
jgi:dCTP deaminase